MDEIMFGLIADEARIKHTDKLDQPPVAISAGEYMDWDGTSYPLPLATYGNFVFIQAPPKHFKTFFVSMLVAAYLGGNKQYTGHLGGFSGNKSVLHVDTEQSDWHAQKVFNRVGRMLEDPIDVSRHITYALREYRHDERIDFIDEYSHRHKPGLIVIDGIADCMRDVNDIAETHDLVQRIMRISSRDMCAILTVIHSNYGSEKPTGHLGSLMEKKTETQIIIEKNSSNPGSMIARHRRGRNLAFDPISFKIKDGLAEVQTDQQSAMEIIMG